MKKYLVFLIIFAISFVAGGIFSDYTRLLRVYLYSGRDRYSFIQDMPVDIYKLLPERIRLEYLLEYKIPFAFSGPEGNELVLREPQYFLYFKEDDWKLLERNRGKTVPVLLEKLKKPDHSAALALGYLKVKEALPLLRKAFIKDDYFYGWEGSKDTDRWNYTHHYCYEEALEHIIGMPIENYIRLTPVELKNLKGRKIQGDRAAAYVLYRLAGKKG